MPRAILIIAGFFLTLSPVFGQTTLPDGCIKPTAACNGVIDDGPAIQAAINSVPGGVCVRLAANCTYRVGNPITWTKDNVTIKGAGRGIFGGISTIDFEPVADGPALWANGASRNPLYETHISDIQFTSTDTTYKKSAIRLTDVRQSSVKNILVYGNSGFWQGGSTGGSIGLETFGRDVSTFEDLTIYANLPIIIGQNPNFYGSADHWSFRNLYLVALGNPCITVKEGNTNSTLLSNFVMDGFQAWAGCFYGFAWNSILPPPFGLASVDVAIHNVRTEQSVGGYSIFINRANGNALLGLKLDNLSLDPFVPGIYARGVVGATFSGIQAFCGTGGTNVIDMDTTNHQLTLANNIWGAGCTMSPSSGPPMPPPIPSTVVPSFSGSSVPSSGAWQ